MKDDRLSKIDPERWNYTALEARLPRLIQYDSYNMSHIPFVKPEDRVIHYLAIWIQKQGQSMRKKLLFIGFGSSVLHFVFPHLEFMHFYFLVLMLNLKQEKLKKIQGKYLKIILCFFASFFITDTGKVKLCI